MKPTILLLLLLCAGCESYRHKQDLQWNKDYSWVNWPTNSATQSTRKLSAESAQSLPKTITMAWTDNDPTVTFNLYSTTDLHSWNLELNTSQHMATVPIDSQLKAYFVTATNRDGESVAPWMK